MMPSLTPGLRAQVDVPCGRSKGFTTLGAWFDYVPGKRRGLATRLLLLPEGCQSAAQMLWSLPRGASHRLTAFLYAPMAGFGIRTISITPICWSGSSAHPRALLQ